MRLPPQFSTGWFAALRSEEVVASRLTRVQVLGREAVAFRDAGGAVALIDALCPHFGAHLGHGGTIEDGCVRCPFHGLKFDGAGQCVGGGLYAERGYRHLKADAWTVCEHAGMVFVWNGPDRRRPAWPMPLATLDSKGWSPPVTNAGRPLPRTNLFFPTENIIDMTHFVNVHRWDLHHVVVPPHVDERGHMRARIDVTWSAGSQSESRLVRWLGKKISSPFQVEFVIYEPGIAVATTQLTEAQGSLQVRSLILITPVSAVDCHIRAVMSVLDPAPGRVAAALRRRLHVGLPELLAPIFLAVGTADFDGDAMIWAHRTHLENPRPLKEDGPIVAYRRWSERFWPEDYERTLLPKAGRSPAEETIAAAEPG
ncbi:MAG TPA: Rieske 2Fe-2S domain-containing protein [Polyangiaceae bacterium]|jgi:nitrite reductase/ring-hydroxylating ferredoxin subunit